MTPNGQQHAPLTLLGRALPTALASDVHVLAHDAALYCDATWHDVFAVVEHGTFELQTTHGAWLTLHEGASLCFALTGPVVLRAAAGPHAVLASVRRSAALGDVR